MGAKEEPRKNKNGAQHQLPHPRNRNPTSRSRQVLRSFPGRGGGHPLRVPTFRKDCFPCHHQGGRSGGLEGAVVGTTARLGLGEVEGGDKAGEAGSCHRPTARGAFRTWG